MTHSQLQLLHLAKRQLDLEEADYRLVLRNVGGVASSKLLTQPAFERVMAFLESRGFQQLGRPGDYWQMRCDHQGVFASSREVHQIRHLAESAGYDLPGLCRKWSNGRTADPGKLHPAEARKTIEMLKGLNERKQRRDSRDAMQPSLPF